LRRLNKRRLARLKVDIRLLDAQRDLIIGNDRVVILIVA
jgi:hypothetical protein